MDQNLRQQQSCSQRVSLVPCEQHPTRLQYPLINYFAEEDENLSEFDDSNISKNNENENRQEIINVSVSLEYFTAEYAEQFRTAKDWHSFHAGCAYAAEINAWHSPALPAKKTGMRIRIRQFFHWIRILPVTTEA